MHHSDKLRADQSRRFGDMAIFRFLKIAAVHHHRFVQRLLGQSTKRAWWCLSLCKIWLESAGVVLKI